MRLKVIASSSKGNCYIIGNKEEILILEFGVTFASIKKGVDFELDKVVGVLLTHSHKDHSKCAKDIVKARLPLYSSAGTFNAIGVQGNVMTEGKVYKIGNFKVLPFGIMHDVPEPFGFLINHPDTGNILFATDTYFLPNRFANLSHILIEANYSDEIIEDNLRKGIVNGYLRDRTLESHMSLKTTIETLQANDLGKVVTIVLLHLSDRNSNAQQFKNEVWLSTGKPTFVAEPGLDIKITKTPW